ncbi:glycosyltransferase family 2 protein [Patescibacteria group bacterium]|nr:glycosyltransferase family 2 protein [Patescibacteria group bacterium]
MSKPSPFLSIVIPSYNESRNIDRGVLEHILEYLESFPHSWEVIFTDDGSLDGTTDKIETFIEKNQKKVSGELKLLKNIHAGKGPTVQAGMLAARGQWRLFSDFDQSTPLRDVEKLLQFAQEFPVVIGSREGEGAKREREPIHRHIMGRGFNLLVQMLAIPGIHDTQCGFKLFSQQATEKLFPLMHVYGKQEERQDAFTGAFDVEVLYLARKFGFPIKEVPIEWKHNETDRVNPIKDSLRMLRDILKVRLADLSGVYRQ